MFVFSKNEHGHVQVIIIKNNSDVIIPDLKDRSSIFKIK